VLAAVHGDQIVGQDPDSIPVDWFGIDGLGPLAAIKELHRAGLIPNEHDHT
jgi:hypothetical protein